MAHPRGQWQPMLSIPPLLIGEALFKARRYRDLVRIRLIATELGWRRPAADDSDHQDKKCSRLNPGIHRKA